MKLNINDIINKHEGKKCVVVGHGPSLNVYLDKLKKLKDDGYIIIGCNNWNEFYPNCVPHYWLNANTIDNVNNLMWLINQYKPVWIYADSVDLQDSEWVEQNIQTDYLPYDQRHFNGKKCSACDTFGCNVNLSDRLTIQEELQRYTGHDKHYGTGDTVVLHSIAFSIIMGFSEIYLLGLDFDYKIGYAKHNTSRTPPDIMYFEKEQYGERILNDIQIIANSAKRIGTQIYNTNLKTNWDIFPKGSI